MHIDPVKVVKGGKGGGGGTYACKELVYAYAMWISAKFHLAVIRAFDALVSGRAPDMPADAPITETQARHLSDIIVAAHPHPGARSRAWWALRRHFGVEHYRDIPAERFEEALAFVKQLRLISDHDEQNCHQLPVFPATGGRMTVLMTIEGDRITHMQPLNPGEVVIDPAKLPENIHAILPGWRLVPLEPLERLCKLGVSAGVLLGEKLKTIGEEVATMTGIQVP